MKKFLHSLLLCNSKINVRIHSNQLRILFLGLGLLIGSISHAQLPQFDDFESGIGNWIDGGNDCYRNPSTALNGSFHMQLRDDSNSSRLTSNAIDLTAYNSVTIDFIFYTINFANGEELILEYNDGTGYTAIATYTRGVNINNNTIYAPSVTLNSGTFNLVSNGVFRFRCDGSNNSDIARIDDINITGVEAPCTEPTNQPTNLVFSAVTNSSIDGSFTAASSAPDSYLVVYSTSNIAPVPSDTTVYNNGDTVGAGYIVASNNANTTFSATGLTASTTYYFYVFSFNDDCVGGPDYLTSSPLTGNETTGLYCQPTNTDPNHFINDFETSNGLTNISNLNSGNSINNYGDYTGLSVSQYQGGDVNFVSDMEFLGAFSRFGVSIFIDYNNDGDFYDAGETVYSSNAYVDPAIGSFTIPLATPAGNYRMRIVADRNDSTPDPCFLIIDQGEIEDYTLSVLTQIPCSEPTDVASNLLFNSVTETTMNMSFTPAVSSSNIGYLVIYNTTGTLPTIVDGTTYAEGLVFSGNTVLSNDQDTAFALSGLTDSTTYYFYIFTFNTACIGEPNYNNTTPLTGIQATPAFCSLNTGPGTSAVGCPSVDAGGLGLSGGDIPPFSCAATSTTTIIEADFLDLGDTTSYNVESIPFAPPYQFGCLENPVSVNTDDVWSDVVNIPFDFCFYGNTYSSVVIGSNGVVSFDTTLATTYSGWVINDNIPSNVNSDAGFFGPSIYGVHHDVDPSIGGEIGYQLITLDTGCRALVASWFRVPMYENNSILYTGMMVFYEETNIIEVYIDDKTIDGTWNNGNATVGLQADATNGIVAPNRNSLDPNWTAAQEAWRFVPSGTSITDLKWYANSISAANEIIDPNDDGEITVTPTSTTDYIAEVTYTLCNGSEIVVSDTTTVTLNGGKTWDGSVSSDWDNPSNWTPFGVPVITDCVTIPVTPNDPIMSSTSVGLGFNLEIYDGASLTQQPNASLTIDDIITIHPTGDLEIRDNASVIQITDVATNQNIGNARLHRYANNIDYNDYAYWSSPVDVFDVEFISPGSPSSVIYKWQPTFTNGTAGEHGTWINTQENMIVGKGYAVRGLVGGFIANTAQFNGVLNNGQISHPISRGSYTGIDYPGVANTATAEDDNWNLIGNPYPSAISLADFTAANADIDGTLYFWRHLTATTDVIDTPFYENYAYNYSPSDYLAANSMGSTPAGFGGYIASGQGFFALMLDSAPASSTVNFSNTMRGTYANDGFFRNDTKDDDTIERHRIWLDLVDENTNTANSILVGYASGATDGIDRLFDGHLLNQTSQQFYSIASDSELAINGKGLPFNDSDTIPLGFKTPEAGSFAISINSLDGLFEGTTQAIYVEDTELNIIHDLRSSPYLFATSEGTFNDRFILRFNNDTLSLNQNEALSNLKIKAFNNTVVATSQLSAIKMFELFDITGRVIHKNLTINNTKYVYKNATLSNGPYLVKVSLSNGVVITRKIIL